jgi:hypothetical protein
VTTPRSSATHGIRPAVDLGARARWSSAWGRRGRFVCQPVIARDTGRV